MCFEANPPATPLPANVAMLTAMEQFGLAPAVLTANRQFAPAYNELSLQNLDQYLTGTPATDTKAAVPGLLDLYQNDIVPALTRTATSANTAQRTADAADANAIAPAVREALRQVNPDAAGLLDQLNQSAREQLKLGNALTPADTRLAQQNNRAAWSARGLVQSPAAALDESQAVQLAGENRGQQRQQFAQGVTSQDQAFYSGLLNQILGQNNTATGTAPLLANLGSTSATPAMLPQFNPESSFGSDIAGAGFNAQANANIATANNHASIISGGISSL